MAYPLKGIVLAAGFGTRLKPLTDECPKPLFPFGGPSLLELALARMEAAGITSLACNAHHLAVQIIGRLSHHPFFAKTHVSIEKEILGTGGFLGQVASWLGQDHLLIYNGDIVTDVDLDLAIEQHFATGAMATMVLLPVNLPTKRPVLLSNGRVVGIGRECEAFRITKNSEHTFTGIHILAPSFIERVPRGGFVDIIDTYQEVIASGALVNAFIHDGIWHDMGTPRDYWLALTDVIAGLDDALDGKLGLSALAKRLDQEFVIDRERASLFAKSAKIGKGVEFGRGVICHARSTIGDGAKIESCVVLPGATVAPKETVRQTIVAPRHRAVW